MQKNAFTLAEAAVLLNCHKETLRRAILEGSLQAARLGREYRISHLELQKFWHALGGGELFDASALEQMRDFTPSEVKPLKGKKKPKSLTEQLLLPTD